MSHTCGTFFFMANKKPDNVADNPGLLPYGSNIGAPAFRPTDLTSFKQNGLSKVEKVFDRRYKELVEQAETLQKSFMITQEVYESKYKFEPLIGEIYHLYEDSDGSRTLSLIDPTQWNRKHLYSVVLNSDMTWTKID
jgi:hypothetical protein